MKTQRPKAQDQMSITNQGQVSNHNDSNFRQCLSISQRESVALFWQDPYSHLKEKQEPKNSKTPEMERVWQCGGETVYFLSKIIIYKWQKAICLIKQLHKFIQHVRPFSQYSE